MLFLITVSFEGFGGVGGLLGLKIVTVKCSKLGYFNLLRLLLEEFITKFYTFEVSSWFYFLSSKFVTDI